MEFTREQAINIAIRCAKEYKRKLSNTRLFVVYRDRESNNIMALEVLFRPSNFQHLTGLIMVDENGQEKKGSRYPEGQSSGSDIFDDCIC